MMKGLNDAQQVKIIDNNFKLDYGCILFADDETRSSGGAASESDAFSGERHTYSDIRRAHLPTVHDL